MRVNQHISPSRWDMCSPVSLNNQQVAQKTLNNWEWIYVVDLPGVSTYFKEKQLRTKYRQPYRMLRVSCWCHLRRTIATRLHSLAGIQYVWYSVVDLHVISVTEKLCHYMMPYRVKIEDHLNTQPRIPKSGVLKRKSLQTLICLARILRLRSQ